MKNPRAISEPGPKELLRWLEARQGEMTALLHEFVECESPSTEKAAVNAFGARVAESFAVLPGARVRVHKLRECGNALQIDLPGGCGGGRVLMLGHLDTVYPVGTLATMPWREHAGRLYGPGVFDMKGGIVMARFALEPLLERDGGLPVPVTLLFNPDEETGSAHSRTITARLAKQARAVLVLEPAAGPHGALKTSRKGTGHYLLRVEGREAHSGLDPEKGASAVLELARQLVRIAEFSNPARGVALNPGVVRGGTRSNVVAGRAEAEIDARANSEAQARQLHQRMLRLKPLDRRCTLEISGGMNRPPFECSAATARLFRLAAAAARELGFTLEEAAVGGGSDGNLTAALGVPTLDGLGAVGDGAHAAHEHVVAQELPRRAALLARLLEKL